MLKFETEQLNERALHANFTEVQQQYFDRLMSELEVISGGLGFAELKAKAEAGSKEALQVLRDYIAKKEQVVGFIETKEMIEIIVPEQSKRGPLLPKSLDNSHPIEEPDPVHLMSEVELTSPEKAVEALKQMFPSLNTEKWSEALEKGIAPAIKACQELGIDPERLVVHPWIKRKAMQEIGSVETLNQSQSSGSGQASHYGALIEQVILPKLEELYKAKGIEFKNYLAGQMSDNEYLQLEPEFAKWLDQREQEVEGDICFSGAILDLQQGFSPDATKHELAKMQNLIGSSSYITMQMLLTQTQLQTKWEELHWWMPSDKYDPDGGSSFRAAFYCGVLVNAFGFGHVSAGDALAPYGSVLLPYATK